MANEIRQPRNTPTIEWSGSFQGKWSGAFDKAQEFVDSECIRLMTPYTPAKNNILYKSAAISTDIGSGEIVYHLPYARYQYYGKLMVSPTTGSPYARKGETKVLTDKDLHYSTMRNPKAQRLWFEVMKAKHLQTILRGAIAITKKG